MGMGIAVVAAAGISAVSSKSAASKAERSAAMLADVQKQNAKAQANVSMQALEFQKKQYADWENIFGPIQQNLSSYYQNLNQDTITSLGIQNIEQEFSRSIQSLDENLAKRGMSNSGAMQQGFSDLEYQRAKGRAEIKIAAPGLVAKEQSGFLGIGMNQKSSLQQGVANSYATLGNVYGSQSMLAGSDAAEYRKQAASSYAGIGNSIGTGINTYMKYNATQDTGQQSGYTQQQPDYLGSNDNNGWWN